MAIQVILVFMLTIRLNVVSDMCWLVAGTSSVLTVAL